MPTRNVNLTDHFDAFIAAEIESGRYSNASEVMRAGLRLLEQHAAEHQQRIERLRALAAEGFSQLDQGLGIELEGREHIEQFIAKLGQQARETNRSEASSTAVN